MASNVGQVQPQAIEAIAEDAVTFLALFLAMAQHRQSALLFHGVVPIASMFVVESHDALVIMYPAASAALSAAYVDLLRASRHRAKLLDDTSKSLDEVAGVLVAIVKQQRESFLQPHSGFLAPLKRAIQPDMSLSTYQGHIFSTTHATIFGFGEGVDFASSAFSVGKALGAYATQLVALLQAKTLPSISSSALSETVQMRDIKHDALYRHGTLGTIGLNYAAGISLLLTTLNLTHYVLRRFLPAGGLTLFRLKFLAAFHADSNLRVIQNRLAINSSCSREVRSVFAEALGNSDSRWLRKCRPLRNLLVHYLIAEESPIAIPAGTTRRQTIEYLSGNLSYDEVDTLLDRHLAHLSCTIETGFNLSGDPFWYGKVS